MRQQFRRFVSAARLRIGVQLLLALALLVPAGCSPASPATSAPATSAQSASVAPAEQAQPAASGEGIVKLNLNTASGEQFQTIPNVGNRMVREFNEYRPYSSILQFRKEIGKYVDAAQVAAYEQYLFVPIDPNQSDEATLQQIPGVDAALSGALIAGRPYASNAAFLEKLAESLSGEQVALAESYLVSE